MVLSYAFVLKLITAREIEEDTWDTRCRNH